MLIEATRKPIRYCWPGGDLLLSPGRPVELPDNRARRLLKRAPDKVRVIDPLPLSDGLRAGCWVEWLSPALPRQRGEVLAVHSDSTFDAFHPITEAVCRMPLAWVQRVLSDPINRGGKP